MTQRYEIPLTKEIPVGKAMEEVIFPTLQAYSATNYACSGAGLTDVDGNSFFRVTGFIDDFEDEPRDAEPQLLYIVNPHAGAFQKAAGKKSIHFTIECHSGQQIGPIDLEAMTEELEKMV